MLKIIGDTAKTKRFITGDLRFFRILFTLKVVLDILKNTGRSMYNGSILGIVKFDVNHSVLLLSKMIIQFRFQTWKICQNFDLCFYLDSKVKRRVPYF